jgi:fatty acyl-CoA reductase
VRRRFAPLLGSAFERKFRVFLLQLFHRVRKEKPNVLNKVVPVHGDVTLEDLGLTPEAKARLQQEVSVVFHFAATLRLEAKLKDATEMNTTGTWRILQLARGMIQLKVRLDDAVSTAVVM